MTTLYCPFCRSYAALVVTPAFMGPQLVCMRCSPNWRPPALWRRVVRWISDRVTGGPP